MVDFQKMMKKAGLNSVQPKEERINDAVCMRFNPFLIKHLLLLHHVLGQCGHDQKQEDAGGPHYS